MAVRLGAARRRRRLTKREMARRIIPHVTDQCPSLDSVLSYVKRWEAGRSGITERYRFACAKALEMDEDELFGAPGEGRADEEDAEEMERRRIYQHRPAQILLRQIEEAGSYARNHICGGLVDMSASRAQMLALAGDGKGAENELRQAESLLGQLPSTALNPSVMGWVHSKPDVVAYREFLASSPPRKAIES
jgi:transcriptional regulator with XRE-family HTH domain